MTGSYLDKSGKKLPNDWRSYLRMRGGAWEQEIDQNKNYSTDLISDLTSRSTFQPECYARIGKYSYSSCAGTNEPHSEQWFTPTKSVFNAWVSSAHRNPSPKIMSLNSKSRTSYSPIRNRYSTRFLPLRSHLDTRNEEDRPYFSTKSILAKEQVEQEDKSDFILSKSYIEPQPTVGARRPNTPLWRMNSQRSTSDQGLSGKANKFGFGSAECKAILLEDKLNQNRSAERSKSPRGHWQTPQLVDKFWWETTKTSKKTSTAPKDVFLRLSRPPGAGDAGHGGTRTFRSGGCQQSARNGGTVGSAARDSTNRTWSSKSSNQMKSLQKDYNMPKQPDARTVEIKRQLMAAREKVQQKDAGFNLRILQPVKQPVPRETKTKYLVPYEPLCQRGSRSKSELVYYSPLAQNNKRRDIPNIFTRTTLNLANEDSGNNLRYSQSLHAERPRENTEEDQRLKMGKELVVALDRSTQSSAARKTKRRCKSAVHSTKTNNRSKASTGSSKIFTKHKARQRQSTASHDSSFNAFQETVLKSTDNNKPERPHSAGNLSSIKGRGIGAKENNVNLLRDRPTARKHRKRTGLGERTENANSTNVNGENISPKRTHSHNLHKSHQNHSPKLKGAETVYGRANTGVNQTLLSEPLRKLAEARRKLRELIEAGESRQCHGSIPPVMKSIDTLQDDILHMPSVDHSEGGLCPPQHNYDIFFYNDKLSMTQDLDDGKLPDKNHDSLQEKNPSGKGDRLVQEPRSPTPLRTLERFPKLKAHTAVIHKPSAIYSKQNCWSGTKNSKKSSPRDGIIKQRTETVTAQCESMCHDKPGAESALTLKTESSDSKKSLQVSWEANGCHKEDQAAGDIAEVKDTQPSRAGARDADAERSLPPPPSSGPARGKKRRLKGKKKSSVQQDKSLNATGKQGSRSTWFQPKTYHQLGLAPLVRSPSSENTFHFAVDLGTMQLPTKLKTRRRKRKTKRSSK